MRVPVFAALLRLTRKHLVAAGRLPTRWPTRLVSPLRRPATLAAGLAAFLFLGAGPPTGAVYRAPLSTPAPQLDGRAADACWAAAEWCPLNQRWLGPPADSADFHGRYKVVWTAQRLYVLAEITDDVLRDTHPDPLTAWWDDDCLEIFVDPDHSGGDHQYTYNAWAYHVALDGHVVDVGPDQRPHLFDEHVQCRRTQRGTHTTWEAAVTLYPATYDDRRPAAANRPLTLRPGQPIGFALAYCDSDTSAGRENFFGSEVVAGSDQNRGWIDAGIFGTVLPTAGRPHPARKK